MRRLTRRLRRDEHGAFVVLMAAFVTVILGMAALVVDVGSLLEEKRQLQNGADAGALAVAQSCALGACNDAMATAMADSNSRDGRSSAAVTYPAAKQVAVRTSTISGGTSILPYSFAQTVAGVKGQEVSAKATATWRALGRATALRLAISQCDVVRLEAGGFGVPTTVEFHSTSLSCGTSSGADSSGAFGFLDDDDIDNTCELTVSVNQRPSADPGAIGPAPCLSTRVNTDVLLVVFDRIDSTGTNTAYRVTGFARFHVTGYRFGSQRTEPPPCTGSTNCIRGHFVRFVTPSEAAGGGGDFGSYSIHLVS
jgi:hypothetical protein